MPDVTQYTYLNPFFINNSDWVICLENGKIVYEGRPKEIPSKQKRILGV